MVGIDLVLTKDRDWRREKQVMVINQRFRLSDDSKDNLTRLR